jgi:hypothetical protein
MGLKSSPYHLKKFMELVYSQESIEKFSKLLSKDERDLLPIDTNSSEINFLISYFDDCFIHAFTYEQLYVCFKLFLMIARDAKIKFSIEKTKCFTKDVKVLGYAFNTEDSILKIDEFKASDIFNMKKPASLYELHLRLASFQYQSIFLPYLKHVLYPLHFMLRKREFRWTEIEETSWQLAKTLATLNLRLTLPDPKDNLVLTTDASKIAASACLFREKNGKLELVGVNSKYFSVVDLNKCSYMLESIALGYGLKVFASHILNCESTVRIFTDAKSLIYAKRASTHSIMLNSTLNYLQYFVSLVNVEIYHLPGYVNILADVMSRAISENINCALTMEHPISKQWAKEIPPISNTFQVSKEALFEFLSKPLKSEPQDIYNREHKKLSEPKSMQEYFDIAKEVSEEERYNNALTLLQQWNRNYEDQEALNHVSICNTALSAST